MITLLRNWLPLSSCFMISFCGPCRKLQWILSQEFQKRRMLCWWLSLNSHFDSCLHYGIGPTSREDNKNRSKLFHWIRNRSKCMQTRTNSFPSKFLALTLLQTKQHSKQTKKWEVWVEKPIWGYVSGEVSLENSAALDCVEKSNLDCFCWDLEFVDLTLGLVNMRSIVGLLCWAEIPGSAMDSDSYILGCSMADVLNCFWAVVEPADR